VSQPPPIDAFLLLSFGGPQGPDDVMPFLRRVTAGRGVPDERLAAVAEHYLHYGGISPITAQNIALLSAVEAELKVRGVDLPVYFGNRNWHPFLLDTARTMVEDGIEHAAVLTTSATSSYSGCRQYREDLSATTLAMLEDPTGPAPAFTKLRHYFDHPGFIRANIHAVHDALVRLAADVRDDARLVFTAHSIPVAMNQRSGPSGNLYERQQRETARLVAEGIRGPGAEFDLVWQSRSGPPSVAWLEPDINDHLASLAAAGVKAIVVAPTGFISDHMEVVWDLDEEARLTAEGLGLAYVRASTAGTHPAFVSGVVDLIEEVLHGAEPQSSGTLGLCGVVCPSGCCEAPRRHGTT